MLSQLFEHFAAASPLTVMVRAIMERALAPEKLDELFEQTAQHQYTRELLFSGVVEVMGLVVCGIHPSVNAAYKALSDQLSVSKPAFYSKLNGMEPQISQALVRYSAEALAPVIGQLGSEATELLPGYRLKIVDGNHLGATDHRLKALRGLAAGPLPGHSLTVLDPQLMMAVDVFPCEDAYTQERALLPQLIDTVSVDEVWIGDRNLCTQRFLTEIAHKQAYFVIREHQNLPWQELGPLGLVGPSATGDVYEQPVELNYQGQTLSIRRVVVKLDQPTRHGDREVAILTNLPVAVASAVLVAQLYRERWSVEGLFQVVTDLFHCELKSLGYPKAALFTFCMALFAYNIFATLKAALRSVHGAGKIDAGLSDYYVAEEVRATYRGMMIALPASDWEPFAELSLEHFCQYLLAWAAHVPLKKFSSSPRAKKRKQPPRSGKPKRTHVSTARILSDSTQLKKSP